MHINLISENLATFKWITFMTVSIIDYSSSKIHEYYE